MSTKHCKYIIPLYTVSIYINKFAHSKVTVDQRSCFASTVNVSGCDGVVFSWTCSEA